MRDLPILLAAFALLALAGVVLAWQAYRFGVRRARRAAAELTTLNEIGLQLLRSQNNVDDLCELVLQQAAQIVPTAIFQVGLFEGNAYHIKAWVRNDERLPHQVFPEGGRQGIMGWVRRTGQPLLVHDFEAERSRLPAFPEFELEDPPRSGLFVPLIAGASTLGVIAVQSREPGAFDEEDLRLLTALANQAAGAIRNAQLYEHARYRAEQLNLIGQVSARISAVQALPGLFNQIVTLVAETFGYYSVSIFILEEGHLIVGASTSSALKTITGVEPGQGMVGWAARQGQTALANNVADDERYRKLGVLAETRSEISLPLKVEDRVLGVLDVQSDRVDAFSTDDVFLLETLAAQIALAIEQAQTYDAERQLSQRLEALIRVSQAVVSELDLDDLLDRLVELIAEHFGFERIHIFVRIADLLVFRAGMGPHTVRWLIDELAYATEDDGLIPKVARTSVPELVNEVSESADYVPGEGVEDTRSEMTIPIQMAGRVLGVLDVQSTRSGAFSEEDLVLMQALADSAAVAIRNAALYASERRRRSLADALREVSATLVSKLDLDSVLAEVLEGLRHVMTVERAGVLVLDDPADQLTLYVTSGPRLEGYVSYRLPLSRADEGQDGPFEETIRTLCCEVLGIDDRSTLLMVPLAVGGILSGYVFAEQPSAWLRSQIDSEIVAAFANQAAIAISNARLYASQQIEAYVTTVLLQVAEAVNAQVEPREALETIARLTALLAGVSRCLILRWEPDEAAYYMTAQYGVARERFLADAAGPLLAEEHPLLELMSVTDSPLAAGQGYQLSVPPPVAELLSASAVLCLPLHARRGLVGLLIVDDPRQSNNPRLLSILTGIAHQTATVLETAHLQASALVRERLEQELEVARSIQASFIPDEPPQVEGWQVAATWRAARQVSGDFYDFIPLPNDLWGLVIADVADKGMPAALFMAVCRTLLRAAAVSRTSPAATLRRVNELLFNDARTDLFVTVFYAVWNPRTGVVTCASGGHNAPLLVRRHPDQVVEMDCRGIALGVIPEITLEEHRVTLKPDEMLVAYTDGVTEAMRSDYTEWGVERFKQTLLPADSVSAGELLDRVLAAVEEYVGDAPQSDDLTLLVLKREREDKRGSR